MEPRTGKTKTTIDWLSCLNQLGWIDRVIIVAPNRILGTWVNEFHAHCPRIFHITVWDAKARQAPPPPVTGTHQLHVILVNYQAFSTPGRKTSSGRESKASGRWKARQRLLKWCDPIDKAAMVIDESHGIKSPSGRASNMIVNMGQQFPYRLILTGTPITKAKRAYDIYMQWQFLNPSRFKEFDTLAKFKAHYGRWIDIEIPDKRGGRPGATRKFPKYLGPKNFEELQARIRKDAVVVRREDCFDLPPREDLVRYVDLKASRPVYDQMAKEMIALLEDGAISEAAIQLVQQLRLTQISSGFVVTDTGESRRIGFEKADVLEEELTDLFEKGQKVVVAARWKADLDLIEEMAENIGFKHWSIRGGVKRADSDAAIQSFKHEEDPAVMVVQPAAAGYGIDLSTAATMIWFSHTPSWVDFTQCCDRIALSRNSTTFIHIVARHTADEILMDTLANDGDIGKAILRNPNKLLTGVDLHIGSDSRFNDMMNSHKRKRKS
jgi:SNF2 family DNA or RNA helicase